MCDTRKVLVVRREKKKEREVILKLLLSAGVGVGCRQFSNLTVSL